MKYIYVYRRSKSQHYKSWEYIVTETVGLTLVAFVVAEVVFHTILSHLPIV